MEKITPTPKGAKTRTRILMTAMDLFNTKGYSATRISDILRVSGVQKGTLYFYFRSKEELALCLIREARKEYLAFLEASASGASALKKVDNILDAVVAYHAGKGFVGGCLFGNVALEMGDQSRDFRDMIREIFSEWTGLMARLLEEAAQEDSLALPLEPYVLARHIVSAVEGGIMLSRLTKDRKDMLCSIESIKVLLASGAPKARGRTTRIYEKEVGNDGDKG